MPALRKPLIAATVALFATSSAVSQSVPPALPNKDVRATVLGGEVQLSAASTRATPAPQRGDIALNFPATDVRVVAKAVLGDILRLPYAIAPGLSASVSIVTPYPLARTAVLPFFEDALRKANLALVQQGGVFTIQSLDQARASGVVGESARGFSNEILQLQFVNASQMKALLDPILPGVVTQADASRNTLTLAGTSGQRASARDLLKQFDVNWLRNMSFALFVPQRTDSRLIVPELEKLINAPDAPTRGLVRLISMEKLNGILAVSSQRQYLEDVNRWIDVLDREGQNNEQRLFVYRVQNGRSRDLAKTLNTAFGAVGEAPDSRAETSVTGADAASQSGDRAKAAPSNSGPVREVNAAAGAAPGGSRGHIGANISSDDGNNAVIVFGTPREYAIVEDALRKLDVVPYQVLIEAAITEVSLTDDLRYGLQWNFASGETSSILTDSNADTSLVRATPGFSFLFSHSNKISAVLNTLESKTKINVVSAPKLIVLNNQTAALQVGDQVPILTQTSTSNIGNSATVNSVEYRDTGVILKITPRVNGSGLVLLDVAQEVSDVKSRSSSGVNSPTISTRRISTSVAVQDGEVLALGGLIRNTQTRDKVGLPFLSQIPVIGGLFGRQVKGQDKIELIVLIKPQVIRSVDDGRAITNELRQKIRSLEPFSSGGRIP